MQIDQHANQKLPNAVIHVDLDGAPHIYRAHGWPYRYPDDPIAETGFKNLLNFLNKNKLHATLFTIASDLDDPRKREWLNEAVSQGHEIASHSLTHANFTQLDRGQKEKEIAESREKLESQLGVTVKGFRVPSYHVDRDCLELLEKHDYAYDSSVFPTRDFARRLQVTTLLNRPFRPLYDGSILELPLPAYKPAPFPFHPCYSLILGTTYFRWGLRKFRKSEVPLILLFHLTDFAEPLPFDRLCGLRSKMFTLSHLTVETKLSRCQEMLDMVRQRYCITNTQNLIQESVGILQQTKPLLLAISTTHETGAAIFEGSKVLSAINEERLDRIKFSTNYPPKKSIEEAIRIAGIDPGGIRDVIISGLSASQLLPRTLRGQLRDFREFHGWNDYFPHLCKLLYRAFYFYRALQYRSILPFLKKKYGIRPKLHFVVHHLCHAAAVYRTAPFDDALIVTADGVGDEVSLTISRGQKGHIKLLKMIPYPHSFGQFYTACTQVLGFRGGRHEGKITGLSGYGKVDPELYHKVKSTIRDSGPNFTLDKRYYTEGIIRGFSIRKLRKGENLFDALEYRNYKTPLKKLLQGYPRENVAAVFQQLLEEEMEAIVRPYAEETGLKNLALCGGVFANVKLNASLFRHLGMDQVYIFPHMGDGGLAIGAALEFLQTRPTPFNSVYWGSNFTEKELETALLEAKDEGLHFKREENIEKVVADLLAQKKVIARFNGRMEFGPRALGNRSILYCASDVNANSWLNQRLGRTEFMPFAPIVMKEKVNSLFKDISGTEHACNFMTIILECTEWTKEHCPAVVHVDGTARPQFVTKETNPSMHAILKYYDSLTGIPLLVNTSFNMHEEPIVCTPNDAVRAFLASRLDYLAIGPFLAWIGEKTLK